MWALIHFTHHLDNEMPLLKSLRWLPEVFGKVHVLQPPYNSLLRCHTDLNIFRCIGIAVNQSILPDLFKQVGEVARPLKEFLAFKYKKMQLS